MCPSGPSQQLIMNDSVRGPKGFVRTNIAVVVGPAPDDRVELGYQRLCRLSYAAFYAVAAFLHQRLEPFLGGLDEQGVVILAHVLAKKVKPRFNVGDGGLLL